MLFLQVIIPDIAQSTQTKTNPMKKITLVLLCAIICAFTLQSFAGNPLKHLMSVEAGIAPKLDPEQNVTQPQSKLQPKQLQELLGRKLTLKEKVALKIFRWKQVKAEPDPKDSSRNGRTAKTLGIIALAALLIFPLATLVCGILAIVFGQQAKKINPDDRNAKAGIIMGIIALGVLVLFVAALIVLISAYTW